MAAIAPLTAGPAIEIARAAIVLVHGRGGSAQDMLGLYEELDVPWCAAIAPQAPGHSWYPRSFLAPLEQNQPDLDSALGTMEAVVTDAMARGVTAEWIAILGFSQGACLTAEFAARYPRPYGAIMGLTGGLIGPPGTARDYPGRLDGARVFLGSSDPDPHVPFDRVVETRDVLSAMGAAVELRRYPGMAHTINADELDACRTLIERMRPKP